MTRIIIAFTLPHILPAGLAAYRSDLVFRLPPSVNDRSIYLTIDEGPSPATDEILRVLAKHNISATFFITGGHVHDPGQLDGIRAGGSSLGHHTQTTRACSRLLLDTFQHDFDEVDPLLTAADGPHLFRPSSHFGTRE